MSMPTMPKVLYAQMWRRRDLKDAEWHPLHPTAYYDNVPSMRPEPHEPERADERYEIRVVRYVLDESDFDTVRRVYERLRAEVDDVLATALVHDDKPHLLFSAIRKLAIAEVAGARRDEIVQLMDSAYEAARQVDETEG